ncbi:MAG: hypothetical protein LUH18_09470 [Oscillospiraceae bacterium]|nr:hypothetical protein [Oscillospiraceae bacterium]
MSEYTGGRIVPKHCGIWSSVNEYEALSIVLYSETGDSYMARKAVPNGIDITDTDYWAFCADYSAQLSMIASDVDSLETDLKTLQAQVTENVTASTDEDANYAAEVVDARVDSEGETYDSLGENIRSATCGLLPKIRPSTTGIAVTSDSGNVAQIETIGWTVKGTFSYLGTSYVGLFAGLFGTYDEVAGKKIRIVMLCDTDTSFTALITNARTAWGSLDGSVHSLTLGNVSFSEKNGYRATLDLDFSEEKYADFAAELTESHEILYFCLRKDGSSPVGDGNIYFYAYEIDERRDLMWKYVSLYDDILLLQNEIESARNDGTEYTTLQGIISAHREDIDEISKEMKESRTDTYGYTADSLSERLASIDTLLRPRLPISTIFKPKDNSNSWLDAIEGAQMGAEIIRNNARFYFDYDSYVSSVTPAWGGVHFSFCASNDYVSSLSDISKLYLSFKIEGLNDTKELHTGESMKIMYYVNGYSTWGKTINPMTTSTITIGSTTLIEIPEDCVQNVIDSGLPLYITFYGNFLNCNAVADMGQVQMTASIINRAAEGNLSAYTGYTEYAENSETADLATEALHAIEADNALTADESGYADTANLADNFFISTPDELLNVEGVRYSPYMDTVDIPSEYPYSYKYSFQSCLQPYSGTKVENGFAPMVQFSVTLSDESSQTDNQGYVKQLSGMLSWEEMYEKLQQGYTTGYICEIEDCMDYPDGATSGSYPNVLLIYYYNDGVNTKIANVKNPLSRRISDKLTLRVWKFTVDGDKLAEIAEAKEADIFKTNWFGIWHTLKYTDEETMVWNPKWYWQDCAFTADDAFTDDEMLTFFQKKYTYWASYVNHVVLKEKFASIDTEIEELKSDVDEATGELSSIVCWGDSLTAGGGWTTTLQTLSGLTVYNGGTGGENAKTIMARQGGDVMLVNNITIPAECEPVTIAIRSEDGGITTQLGNRVTPLLQGGAHVNPVMIGDIEGTLKWTGSNYADTTGTWTFTRSEAGETVEITRPTAIRTNFDRIHNGKDTVMVIFMGQNGGYSSVDDLINMHKLMIDHSKGKEYIILGLSSGTASSRADYESAMKEAFGRRFISLREYLSTAIYDDDGNIISCYGLDDQDLEMEETHTYNGTEYVTVDEISQGQVPHQILSDSVHYTSGTKTVIGNLIYKHMLELGILTQS